MRSAELTCPLYAATLSDSQRERGRQADCLPLCYDRTRDRMGARVMASGMPGASRRAVLGGATYSVVKVWVRLSGAGRPAAASQSAPHPWRASSAGGPIPGPCARGSGAMSLWPRAGLAGWEMAEARARGEYSTTVLACVKEMDGWRCLLRFIPRPDLPPRCSTRLVFNALPSHWRGTRRR